MKNFLSSFFGTLLIQAMTMVSGVLTARLLLPAGKGELTAIILWPTLLTSLGCLGIWDAIVYHAAGRDDAYLRRLFASCMLVSAVLALALMILGFFLLPEVLVKHSAESIANARLYLWFIPLTFGTVSAMSLFQGMQRFEAFNYLRVSVYVCELTGILILYFSGKISVRAVVGVFLLARVATFTLSLGLALRHFGRPVAPDRGILRTLLGYGVRTHIGTIADSLNLRLDQLLMSVFLASTALGLYVVAVSVSAVGTLVAATLNIVLFPRLAAAATDALRRRLLGRFMRLAMGLSLLSALGLYFLAPWLIRRFFGVDFLGAVPSARVLIAASIVLNGNIILVGGAKAFNFPGAASQAQILGLAFTGLFLFLLLPAYQGYGAAWASMAAYAATFLYLLWEFRRRARLSLRELFVPTADDWTYGREILRALKSRMGGGQA
jgi:O-antigen/teichoic acid export membrane protein